MSLVPTYTYCKDNIWYEDLVYADLTDSWFICFDDDDPVELVVFEDCKMSPKQILKEVKIPYTSLRKENENQRIRPATGGFAFAKSYFLKVINEPFPTPFFGCKWDSACDKRPIKECVIYGFKGLINDQR